MSIYAQAARLKLNAYIYRYYISGGVFAYFYVPETVRFYKFQKDFVEPILKENKELIAKGVVRPTHF